MSRAQRSPPALSIANLRNPALSWIRKRQHLEVLGPERVSSSLLPVASGTMAHVEPTTQLPPSMNASLSDAELSDAAGRGPPTPGSRKPQSQLHLSSSPIFKPILKLEKEFLKHEAKRAEERAAVYEAMPDSTRATHDPPYLAGQPRSVRINIMGALGAAYAPRPSAAVDVAGDLLAVASDVRVQIGSICTGISARERCFSVLAGI